MEKELNSPLKRINGRALKRKIADTTIKSLQLETKQQQQIIGELKPKADYTDKILKKQRPGDYYTNSKRLWHDRKCNERFITFLGSTIQTK